jgi:hypothetical protein
VNGFRRLDERVLPRLARGLGRIADAARGVGRGPAGARPVLLGAAVLAVLAVFGTLLYAESRPAPVDETTADVVRVGAADGDQVAAYLARAKSELAALTARPDAEVTALVSLASYVEPAALTGLLDGVTTVRAFARVPLPDVQTEIVGLRVHTLAVDVPAEMKRTAQRKERAAAEAAEIAAGLRGDGAREKELRTYYERDAAVRSAEAAAYKRLCPCVYGAVVRATPAKLALLAGRNGVRVVDPAPESKRLDRTVFLPLRPEQLTVVAPPMDGALPPTRR